MGIFSKFFGQKPDPVKPQEPSPLTQSAARKEAPAPADEARTIKVFDETGRELFISRNQWLDNVLLTDLERHRDQSDELHGLLVKALDDGFGAEIVPYAEHLFHTDLLPSRGTLLLAQVYLANDRPEDAQLLLEEYLDEEGEDSDILTMLAKVQLQLDNREAAEASLVAALEVEPDLDDARCLLQELQREHEEETVDPASFPATETGLTTLTIEGPLWMRQRSPFARLLGLKSTGAPRFMVIGSTVVGDQAAQEGPADHLSRAVPLLLAEVIHIASDAVGVALIPWRQREGFARFGTPCSDEVLCRMAGSEGDVPDFVIGVTIDRSSPEGKLEVSLIRAADAERLAEKAIPCNDGSGEWIYELCTEMSKLLSAKVGVRMASAPSWYYLPVEAYVADYLVRLEQQLRLSCLNLDFLEGAVLRGEREILDGVFRLCLDQPRNPTVRMLYAQTLRLMRKARPEFLAPYRERADRLQRDYPVAREISVLVDGALHNVFG
ncbi:hypothetical protein GMLC_02820 [Geomonas limicola]|uniref:Uncharacterized protein n=1 Tax=Geomonas limicola TaxID=2740186 RepID=A0A6V8N505_9BACT|nr:tetratricopeptide repeat protein [Geomonas limicola]GFO66703.1 hypothetical protein GMLC_02820 [Geomonas limicola]